MKADLFVSAARGFQILALLCVAYLTACALNALYERLSDRRRR